MKKVGVAADSHSSISQELAKELDIWVLPMPFTIDGECYYESTTLTREQFFAKLKAGASISTSQPTPEAVMALWDEALAECEQLVYIPISSGLSGSCSTARALASEPPYAGRVFVVDNGRVSTPTHRSVLDALELAREGYPAPYIQAKLEEYRDKMSIYVAIDDLKYLKNGGRITPTAAAFGSVLNIKPILKMGMGVLDSYKKCRGFEKAKEAMIEALRHDLETVHKPWEDKGQVYLLVASSASPEETEKWLNQVQAAFPGREILCDDLSMGVSCHIGPGGLGIGCSCRPDRD